jgi:tagaturonate reductase
MTMTAPIEPLRRRIIDRPADLPNVNIGSAVLHPERVLQFGEGNFLRAFVDWQFNELISAGRFNGSIVVVQPLENGMVQMLNEQEGLYTVVQRGYDNGTLVEKMDVITAIRRGINPYTAYDEFLRCASNPDLRFIISNTTESGIEYVRQPKPTDTCPPSYPAKVAILLFERFKAFSGDATKGMILIPCELIEQNGDALKKAVLQHAADWECGGPFITWLEEHNHFCNTLVDRIVPGYPKEEAAELNQKFGYQDNLIVACEVFHKWVIQGPPSVQQELPFETIGLNVVWTDDITPHRTLKVRILNGAHTTFTIPAFLSGKEFVRESMEDAQIGRFIHDAVFEEILPTLRFGQSEKEKFASAVLERFKNPFIKHALISITLNSVSKFKVRVLPSLLEYESMNKRLPQRLCYGLAALIRFYRPTAKTEKGYTGSYSGRFYPIQDSADIVEFFENVWSSSADDIPALVRSVLSHQAFWGRDLTAVPQLSDTVAAFLTEINNETITGSMPASVHAGWNAKILMHQNF